MNRKMPRFALGAKCGAFGASGSVALPPRPRAPPGRDTRSRIRPPSGHRDDWTWVRPRAGRPGLSRRRLHLRHVDVRLPLVRRIIADPEPIVMPDEAGIARVAARGEREELVEHAG